ncbi:hypothetical protein GCM10010869_69410 [Mesorhizobium tianshanense]|uniref:Uncharacterized protein n=1 Tax=Mesorhizobium tianshanense TaxID=39844 RepID=A0A562NN23_9HYPH|nr:hypothetical protein IQ26_03987 [Mesorhizobium tianshanense]GLS41344.1 hypothetical protein GCM10010869_69410 [Mesorhizobium tianshanense]
MITDKAGYKRERTYVLRKYGKSVETCHVAHVKRVLGLTKGPAPNRIDSSVGIKDCPPALWPIVEEAVRHIHAVRLATM